MQAYLEANKLKILTASFINVPRVNTIKYVEALQSKQVPSHRAQLTSIPSFNFKLGHA